MELVNATPLAARIDVGAPLENGLRRGMIVAKATFSFDSRGSVQLDDQDPLPIFLEDVLTPQGLLPRDDMPRVDSVFEVSLLGCAHAPGGRPAQHMQVSMSVGEVRRSIEVFGDRFMVGEGANAGATPAEPFTKMPLTWSRAFGGRADVEVDEGSPVRVQHAKNAYGKGFDVVAEANKLDEFLTCPPGFPRFDRRRALPNLERPDQIIRTAFDDPEPVAWCPPPIDSGVHNLRCFKIIEEAGKPVRAEETAGLTHRAAPEWVLDAAPPAGTPIVLEGVTPEGRVELALPGLEVGFDYVIGGRAGSRQLALQAMVMLPEERRFYLVYRLPFQIEAPTGEERMGRLTIKKGGA
ncbi:MAG: DUF2169 domain-containing protein [Polyangiaceae bacterium]|nr:DUF2169 domain-containing protein [Polyangiaceae bacterium]